MASRAFKRRKPNGLGHIRTPSTEYHCTAHGAVCGDLATADLPGYLLCFRGGPPVLPVLSRPSSLLQFGHCTSSRPNNAALSLEANLRGNGRTSSFTEVMHDHAARCNTYASKAAHSFFDLGSGCTPMQLAHTHPFPLPLTPLRAAYYPSSSTASCAMLGSLAQ
jgi:hypothetical protein